jgi:ATP-dependent Clp protease ATP-binding subunit ClpC
MWRQLTQKARRAILLAHEEAERLGFNHVGSEHLLLAITREDDCVAAMMLNRLGIELSAIRSEVMRQVATGDETLDDMQLSADAKHAIDFAFAETKLLKDDWVGTEHLLIGLVHEAGGVASSVLRELGADLDALRSQLRNVKAGTLPFDKIRDTAAARSPLTVI